MTCALTTGTEAGLRDRSDPYNVASLMRTPAMPTTETTDLHELARSFRKLRDHPPVGAGGVYGPDDLNSLIEDIDRLIAGWRPSDADLAQTAHIDRWRVCYEGEAGYLVGWISRHPWEPHRRLQSNTSGVIVADCGLRWVRTIGRFYELGETSGPEHVEALRGMRAI